MKKFMTYKYLFIILSVLFVGALENLYSQNTNNIIASDVELKKIDVGYKLFIKAKNENIDNIKIKVKITNSVYSYLYLNSTGSYNSIVKVENVVSHRNFGRAFEIDLADRLYLDNANGNRAFELKNVENIILELYDIENKLLSSNEIKIKVSENTTEPSINIRNVEKEGDFYAFYLYYSGGNNGRYAFYVREGLTNNQYIKIKTSFGNNNIEDNSGVIIEDTYQKGIGKKLYIKAYFKELPEDRYLSFNIFDTKGNSYTYPVDYVIETPFKEKEEIIEKEYTKEEPVPIREIDKTIDVNTNIIIVDNIQNQSPSNSKFDGRAIDIVDNAVKVFKTENHHANNPNELKVNINNILRKYDVYDTTDLIIVLDTTSSMMPYIKEVKKEIKSISKYILDRNNQSNIGFLLYRDIGDTYLTKKIDYSRDINKIERESKYFYATGGGDKEEPMYEAIQTALEEFSFTSKNRVIMVITDAPPKIIGRADLDLNKKTAQDKSVNIEIILTKEIKDEISDDIYFIDRK